MKSETAILLKTGEQLMTAYRLAPERKRRCIAALMWEHLVAAAVMEDKTVDELQAELSVHSHQIELPVNG